MLDLNVKFSEPTRSMSSERRLTKSLKPLTIIGGGRFALFSREVCTSGLFTSASVFGVILSTSIASVCDRTFDYLK